MTDLSKLFNEACNKARSLAAVWPGAEVPSYQDCMPGSYGTFVDGVWVKQGTIADLGGTLPSIEQTVNTGPFFWSSDKTKTFTGSMSGGVFVPGEESGGGYTAIQYKSESDSIFKATVGPQTIFGLSDDSVFESDSPIIPKLVQIKNYKDLRFVVRLYASTQYRVWGGSSKNSEVIWTGDAEAIGEDAEGEFTAGLSTTESQNLSVNYCTNSTDQLVPVAMLLYKYDGKHLGWKTDNSTT